MIPHGATDETYKRIIQGRTGVEVRGQAHAALAYDVHDDAGPLSESIPDGEAGEAKDEDAGHEDADRIGRLFDAQELPEQGGDEEEEEEHSTSELPGEDAPPDDPSDGGPGNSGPPVPGQGPLPPPLPPPAPPSPALAGSEGEEMAALSRTRWGVFSVTPKQARQPGLPYGGWQARCVFHRSAVLNVGQEHTAIV